MNNFFKTKKPLSGKPPYRLVLLELLPTDGWENSRQPIKDLCLFTSVIIYEYKSMAIDKLRKKIFRQSFINACI